MKRLVQWIQIPELSPLPVMDRVFEECTDAFADDGCVCRKVTRLEDLEDGGLIWMDDAAGAYCQPSHKAIHRILAEKCPTSVFVVWYWRDTTYQPFPRMIFTGEYYVHRNATSEINKTYMSHPRFVPLRLRASESPNHVGHLPRRPVRDYCFMGGGYKMDWTPPAPEFQGIYHCVFAHNFLPYATRREIYLTTHFALGFQSDENIRTGHLSQRIFEGLAYGCIVLCENPLAEQVTGGAVVTVRSKEDMWERMRYYRSHPEEAEERRQRGYEWTRRYGTNRTAMRPFMDRIAACWGENWEVSPTVVSVNLMGGLGNQLFQIAAGYAYAKKHGATFQLCPPPQNGQRPWYWDSLLSSIQPFLVPSLPPNLQPWSESLPTMYRPIEPLPPQGIYLKGYLQSSKYFYTDAIRTAIRDLFRPPADLLHSVRSAYADWIRQADRVVVLHARRTDYLAAKEFHGPLDGSYYRRALDAILPHVTDPIFVLSADDPSFWQDIKEDIAEVYQHPHLILQGESDIRTFVLLQQFSHFILSNSTFIWWCAWLSSARRVIAPERWFGPAGPSSWSDIYESEWKQV